MKKTVKTIFLILMILFLQACATLDRRPYQPVSTNTATLFIDVPSRIQNNFSAYRVGASKRQLMYGTEPGFFDSTSQFNKRIKVDANQELAINISYSINKGSYIESCYITGVFVPRTGKVYRLTVFDEHEYPKSFFDAFVNPTKGRCYLGVSEMVGDNLYPIKLRKYED